MSQETSFDTIAQRAVAAAPKRGGGEGWKVRFENRKKGGGRKKEGGREGGREVPVRP